MNYTKIHNDLITLCKETSPRDRLTRRKPDDIRLCDERLYTEIHHIIPRAITGEDNPSDTVVVLPEEHYIFHLLRYCIHKTRCDFIACKFMRNGFIAKSHIRHGTFLNKLGCHKHFIRKFRSETGWQTQDGVDRIRRSRLKQFPGRCTKTGKVLKGNYSKDHPDVISGKVVHHSKGYVACIDEKGNNIHITVEERKKRGLKARCKSRAGKNNGNYKEMTEDRKNRLFSVVHKCIVMDKYFIPKHFEVLMKDGLFPEFKKISLVWVLKNWASLEDFLSEYNSIYGTEYVKAPIYLRGYKKHAKD